MISLNSLGSIGSGEDKAVAKHLRIDMAEMTDIGRRRSDNQDNLARRVPDDPDELERDGALFVVADGMGGHAAGEIASTVAVQKICEAYFENAQGEVLQGLAQAIKEANEAILTIARENANRMGMGTTLVAAVLCQGILYVANIGDSRAYMLRNGRLRQLTEDHSWVAEQVRAGVLTEEQARTHVHRNVITRSLGTQATVTADVFVEPAREGDILLLCSDGLHGYVPDEAIRQVMKDYPPAEAAQRLIDLANEAGGPDNITVSIFRIDEMEDAAPEVLAKLQLLKTQPRVSQPTTIIAKSPERPNVTAPPPPDPLATDPALPVAVPPAASTGTPAKKRTRSRTWIVSAAAIILVVAFSAAAWDFTLGPFAQSRVVAQHVSADISRLQSDIKSLASYTPTQQLSILANDQQLLQNDLSLNLTASERSDLTNALNHDLAPAVQGALTSYDAQAHIVALSQASGATVPVSCAAQLVPPLVTASAPKGADAFFYALDQSGQAQPITLSNGTATCGKPIGTNLLALASTGTGLVALTAPTAKAPAQVNALGATGAATPLVKLPALAAGTSYVALAYAPKAIVVVERTASGDQLLVFSGAKFTTAAKPVAVPQAVRSLAFGHNAAVYLLLQDGEMATFVPGASTSVHIVGDLQIQPVLPVNVPGNFTSATPVPTVPTGANTAFTAPLTEVPYHAYGQMQPLDTGTPTDTPTPATTETPLPTGKTGLSTPLPTATSLAISNAAVPLVAVADGKGHRVVTLMADGIDLSLLQQYADVSALDTTTAVAFAPDQQTLYALTASALITIRLP
jgi:serine/threonine protein phosphatase PrpC